MSLVDLPEEIILLILVRLDLASVAAIEASCRRLRKVIADAKYVQYIAFLPSKDTIMLKRFLFITLWVKRE